MSKLLDKKPLGEVNSFHLSRIKASIDSLIATHAAIVDSHHAKYTDAEAVTAMGVKGDANPLHHDRTVKYTDAEAVTAMGVKGDANPLHHDRTVKYTDGEVDSRIALANHDTLLNPNGNANEQHLTAAQVAALHAAATVSAPLTVVGQLINIENEDAGVITEVSKDGTLADDSDLKLSTQKAIKAYVDAVNAIGSANKRWKNLSIDGGVFSRFEVVNEVYNISSSDMYMAMFVPLDYVVNGKNLIITQTKIGVSDADASNYVDVITWYGTADHTTPASILSDGTNRTAAGAYTYNHVDITIGGNYEKVVLVIQGQNPTATNLGISWIQVEYYYA